MKYALISDVHANLPALEAVLEDIQHRNVGATYHLGDLVGYAPWPNETVALIRARAIAGVAGNYDSTVGTDYKHCGCRYEDAHQEELTRKSFSPGFRSGSTCRPTADTSPARGCSWFMAPPPSTLSTGPRTATMTSASRWRGTPAPGRAT